MEKKKAIEVEMRNVWTDRYGAIYSLNRKRLLKGPCSKRYEVIEGTEEIDDRAFGHNKSLVTVVIPNTVSYLGKGVFWGCTSLESCVLSESITEINDGAFVDCVSLKKVQLPKRLTHIGGAAFHGCTSLEYIEIPESVLSIKAPIFAGSKCQIIYSGSAFQVIDKALYQIYDKALYGEEALALLHCPTDVEEFVVPESTKYIANNAFHGCVSLKTITITRPVAMGRCLFISCDSLVRINIPKGTKKAIANLYTKQEELLFENI